MCNKPSMGDLTLHMAVGSVGAQYLGDHSLEVRAPMKLTVVSPLLGELAIGLGEHLQSRFAVVADPPPSGETFERAMHALDGGRIELPETDRDVIRAGRLDAHVEPTDFASFLEDEDQAIAIETALQTIHPSDWTVISMLGAVVRPHLIRRPVGPSIWDSVRATAVKDSDYQVDPRPRRACHGA